MSKLFISAAHKSSGKTVLSVGICAALRERGLRVQSFKKGPDYIDPMWLSAASGTRCRNLDFHTTPTTDLADAFTRFSRDADVALVEGNKGLHDGVDVAGADSNAALAKLLRLPVVLVIDTRGMTRGIAPLLNGLCDFDSQVNIAGVILNQVGGPRHEAKLRAAIELYCDSPVLGAVSRSSALAIDERHLGLIPVVEVAEAARRVALVKDQICESVDLDQLLTLAAPEEAESGIAPGADQIRQKPDLRIAVARDRAFGFYYPEDLDALSAAGAELVFIDTLSDPHLPPVDGLIVGGGFPEVHMQALSRNASLRRDIASQIERGLPVYAECGGLMYLSRQIAWHGAEASMVGALPLDIEVDDRPQGRGYVVLRESGNALWPAVRGSPAGAELKAHEFHHARVSRFHADVQFAYDVARGHGVDGQHDGIVYKNVLASFSHQRTIGDNRWVWRFVAFVREVAGRKASTGNLSQPALA